MNNNQEKALVLIRKPDAAPSSTSTRILRKGSLSPTMHIMATGTKENNHNDQLKKLDKQVAEMKKRQKYENLSLSPKHKQDKTSYSILNHASSGSSPHTLEKVPVLDDAISNQMAIRETVYLHSTISTTNSLSNSNNRLNNRQILNSSPIRSTISSSYSNTPPNSSSNQVIKRHKYLSHAELLIPDTLIIDASNPTSSISTPPSSSRQRQSDAASTRPTKADSLNMFDSIPSTNIIEDDSSIQVPDSTSLNNDKSDTTAYDTKHDDCDSANTTFNNHLLSSSPIKSTPRQKKQVAFSSDIESSFISSSPIKGNYEPRSILKFTDHHLRNQTTSLDSILKKDLSLNESWLAGLIIQIPEGYPDIGRFVANCVSGLNNRQFERHYEVFATLNDLIKKNQKIITNKLVFTKEIIKTITLSVRNDITDLGCEIKKGSNAFKLRTSSQGIKLIASLVSVSTLTDELSTIYNLLIKFLKNEHISKNLAASIFQLIKIIPEQYYDKIKSIICSITQMKYFESATVTCEKLNILKRFIILKPAVANKCNYQIMSHVFYSIINTEVSAYSRILFSTISVLTAYAKNDESKLVITKLLSEELEDSCSSITSTSKIPLKPSMTICHALCETMKYLIHLQMYQQTTKIWAYTLYMVCFNRKNFALESWELFHHFQSVFKDLSSNSGALLLCLEAWKTVVYNFQMAQIRQLTEDELTKKLDLLVSPFDKIPLINENGLSFTQWSENERFILLYCRVFYSIRLHMENATESQMSILLEYALRPLVKLKQWDSIYMSVIRTIYTSEKPTFVETAVDCFWLSDFERWKNRITPLPKDALKNPIIFEANVRIGRLLINKPCDIVAYFFNTGIYKQLEKIKESKDQATYFKFAKSSVELISECFDNYTMMIQKGNLEDGQTLFKLIEKIDRDLMFIPGEESLMKLIFNKIGKSESYEFVKQFITHCGMKFDRAQLFIAFMTSDLYIIDHFVDEKVVFPPLINFSIDLTKAETESTKEKIQLSHADLEKMVDNISNAIAHSLTEATVESHLSDVLHFFTETKIFEVLDSELEFKLFSRLLFHFNTVSENNRFFYETTNVDYFTYSLEKFDDMERKKESSFENGVDFLKYLSNLKNVEQLPDAWIDEIGDRLGYILHSDLVYDQTIIKLIELIKTRLPPQTAEKLKMLFIERNVSGLNDTMDVNDSMSNDNMSNDIVSTQIIISSQEDDTAEDEDNVPIKVSDLKSFVIDSICISGSIDEASIRIPDNSDEPVEEHVSPARRTRSHTRMSKSDTQTEGPESKKQKKNKKSKRKSKSKSRSRSRSLSTELENAANEDDGTDMGQFREMLKKVSKSKIKLNRDERVQLEKELTAFLTKIGNDNDDDDK